MSANISLRLRQDTQKGLGRFRQLQNPSAGHFLITWG